MDSYYREYTKLFEYLNLKKTKKNSKIKKINLHQSLKIYYHNKDENNINLSSKETNPKNKNISL